jgi:hypothetical protein
MKYCKRHGACNDDNAKRKLDYPRRRRFLPTPRCGHNVTCTELRIKMKEAMVSY